MHRLVKSCRYQQVINWAGVDMDQYSFAHNSLLWFPQHRTVFSTVCFTLHPVLFFVRFFCLLFLITVFVFLSPLFEQAFWFFYFLLFSRALIL